MGNSAAAGGNPAQSYFEKSQFAEVAAAERKGLPIGGEEPILGLALSGGGIRSASFALGVLQALHGFKVFGKFDYLSTVSGGGYIGGALTYFRNAFADLGERWFPFGYSAPGDGGKMKAMGARAAAPADPGDRRAQQIVAYLRQHASYMTPSREFDRPALVAGVLRGLLSTVLPYFAILTGVFGLMAGFGLFDKVPHWQQPWKVVAETAQSPPVICPSAPLAGLTACQAGPSGTETCAAELCKALAQCLTESCAPPEPPPPGFYLAGFLSSVGIALGAFLGLGFLASSLVAGGFHALDRKERFAQRGYEILIRLHGAAGVALLLAAGLLALSTLPWVHDYLNSLWQDDAELPASFAALFGAIGAAAALIGRLRGVLGGQKAKPTALRAAGMALAGMVFIYGFLLLAYGASVDLLGATSIFHASDWSRLWHWIDGTEPASPPGLGKLGLSLLVCLGGLIAASLISINLATQHRLYRDRLMEVFCAEGTALETGEWARAQRAQSPDGWLVKMDKRRRPYHLINACLVTTDSNKRRYRGRGGDNFVLSPLFCGSDATGWVKTETGMKALSLATAMAVSGAALNAHAGPHGAGLLRNKAYAALLGLLGLNLGVWLPNPKRFEPGARPPSYMPNLLNPGYFALSGRKLNETGAFVQLSDGGHFENLAIYELVRRRARFLWVSDAGQDDGFTFEDLANAIERVRVDFGVNIRFPFDDYDLSHVIPGSATSDNLAGKNFVARYNLSTRGYAIGAIEYPDVAEKGVIVYVKSTLTRFLPGDLYGYKARNKQYPHQTTLDQFFDEEQFEAYRELGYRLASRLFRDIEEARRNANTPSGSTGSAALDSVAQALNI